jgi:hypothetical protein
MIEEKDQTEWTESQSISDFLMTCEGPERGHPLPETEGWRGFFGLDGKGVGGKRGDLEMGAGQGDAETADNQVALGTDASRGRRSLAVEPKDIASSTYTHHQDLPTNIDASLDRSSPTSPTPQSNPSPHPLSPIPPAYIQRKSRPNTASSTSTSIQSQRRQSSRLSSPILLPASQPRWIEPLASAILAPTSPGAGHIRRNSDPSMGVVQFRRRELQIAAEEMYKETQMRL